MNSRDAIFYRKGSTRFYPVNETARLLTFLKGTRTLSPEDLTLIEALGYRVQVLSGKGETAQGLDSKVIP